MKVLWLCNIMLPKVAKHLSIQPTSYGGWLTGLSNEILKLNDFQLEICFPYEKKFLNGECGNLKFYSFTSSNKLASNAKIKDFFREILLKENPEIIHIFGTEYTHTLLMVECCAELGLIERTVISIQGLVSIDAQHYFASLPNKVIKQYTLRDLIKRSNINNRKYVMERQGFDEIKAIRIVKHIIGRTTWDKACTHQINGHAKYHFCNETLRDEFYKNTWNIKKCKKYSIFISQASYPIKGLHFLLEAMPHIISDFPQTHLYIAGPDLTRNDTIIDRLKITSYSKYISELIKKNNLKEHITFIGNLDEKHMCQQYLKSHVFVCPSSIENSPNSLGEAMLLGVPCVSSDVGGVSDMMVHRDEGFVYQADAPYMLAYYVCEIFKDDILSAKLSENARKHAIRTHSKQENTKQLIKIYETISKPN